MQSVLTAASVIVILVMAVTYCVKSQLPNNRWVPLINIVISIILALAWAYTMVPDQIVIYGWAGLICGLAAGGFYDLGTSILNTPKKSDSDIQPQDERKGFE